MDTHGVFTPQSSSRHSLIPRTTVWRVAFLVEIRVFRGPPTEICRLVRRRLQLVTFPSTVHRSRAKVHRPKAQRCGLRLLNPGWLKYPPLHSRTLQRKRKTVRMQSVPLGLGPLRNDGQRPVRLKVIQKTPLVPINLRQVSALGLLQILTALLLCDLNQEAILDCEQCQGAVVVVWMIGVIANRFHLSWRRYTLRVKSKKATQYKRLHYLRQLRTIQRVKNGRLGAGDKRFGLNGCALCEFNFTRHAIYATCGIMIERSRYREMARSLNLPLGND